MKIEYSLSLLLAIVIGLAKPTAQLSLVAAELKNSPEAIRPPKAECAVLFDKLSADQLTTYKFGERSNATGESSFCLARLYITNSQWINDLKFPRRTTLRALRALFVNRFCWHPISMAHRLRWTIPQSHRYVHRSGERPTTRAEPKPTCSEGCCKYIAVQRRVGV